MGTRTTQQSYRRSGYDVCELRGAVHGRYEDPYQRKHMGNTKPTTETWFYRVDIPSDRKHFSKTKPMELKHFDDCIAWWNNREVIPDGEYFKSQKFTADYLLNEQGCNIDLCGYPHEEEEVLDPLDTIREYQERRTSLNAEIDKVLAELEALLPGGVIK